MEKKDKLWHLLFFIGIFFKGVDGVLELAGGSLLLFIKQGVLVNFANLLFQHELSEDPDDLIANYLIHFAANLSKDTELFAAVFLLVHGAIKVSIVSGLFLRKLWVYPLAEVILALFVGYQVYRFFHTFSIFLIVITLVDIFIICLIGSEYKRLKKEIPAPLR